MGEDGAVEPEPASAPPSNTAGGWGTVSAGHAPPAAGAGVGDSAKNAGKVATVARAAAAATAAAAPATAAGTQGGGAAVHICYLCKRKFGSEEQLRKHEELSDMHKQKVCVRACVRPSVCL